MKRLFHKKSAFIKFLITYFTVVVFTILLTIPIYRSAHNEARENTVQYLQSQIVRAAENLNASTEEFVILREVLPLDSAYKFIKMFTSDEVPTNYYSKLTEIRSMMSKVYHSRTFLNEVYLVFPRNNIVISKTEININREDFFNDYMIYEELGTDGILSEIDSLMGASAGIRVIPGTDIKIRNNSIGKALTIMTTTQNDLTVACGVVSEKTIKEMLSFDDLPAESFILMYTEKGRTLMEVNCGAEISRAASSGIRSADVGGEKYLIVDEHIPMLQSYVSVGVPESYLYEQAKPVMSLAIFYICITFILGIIIAVMLAYYNYRPIKKLVSLIDKDSESDNEFKLIGQTLSEHDIANKRMTGEIERMGGVIKTNIFAQLLRGMISSEEDYDNANKDFPEASEEYRIWLINFIHENKTESAIVFNIIEKQDKIISAWVTTELAAIFVPESEAESFKETISLLRSNFTYLGKDDLRVSSSDVMVGVSNMHECFNQAHMRLMTGMSDEGTVADISDKKYTLPSPMELQKLYEQMVANDLDRADETIRALVDNIVFNSRQLMQGMRQSFYLIRYVIEKLVLDQKFEDEIILPKFQEGVTMNENIEILSASMREVCEKLDRRRSNGNTSLKREVIGYINTHYNEVGLYPDAIANHFEISEKYLYKLVKETTGLSTSEYIERMRMEHAMELIRESDAPITKIAEDCGYNSSNTFYKAFKKYYSAPPSNYRR